MVSPPSSRELRPALRPREAPVVQPIAAGGNPDASLLGGDAPGTAVGGGHAARRRGSSADSGGPRSSATRAAVPWNTLMNSRSGPGRRENRSAPGCGTSRRERRGVRLRSLPRTPASFTGERSGAILLRGYRSSIAATPREIRELRGPGLPSFLAERGRTSTSGMHRLSRADRDICAASHSGHQHCLGLPPAPSTRISPRCSARGYHRNRALPDQR